MLDLANTPLASRAWRLQNLYCIRDAEGRLGKFKPNQAQREFYNRMWYCNHILKARKLGFSTFIEILYTDDLLFTETGLSSGIIDYTIEDAESKLAMMRLSWEHMDDGDIHPDTWRYGEAIKRAIPMITASTRRLEFANGSVARCSTSLRGTTPQRTHISELGKTAIWAPIKAKEIVNGAFNAMTPGSVRNIESTHEGAKVGIHYNLLNQAMRLNDDNLSNIQSRFHFFPWFDDPRYVLPSKGHKIRPETLKYFKMLEKDHGIKVSRDQMLWYDHKHQEQGHGMKKEFPSTPGEAFEAIAEGAIYGTEMADLRAKGRVIDFGHEAGQPVFTFWDIGLSDYTAIWLIQPVGRFFLVLDWFEAEGMPGSAMPDVIRAWETKWKIHIAKHFLPHDANTRDRASGKSYVTELKDGGLHNTKVVPRTPDIWLGIGYVRDVLPHCYFHKEFCDSPRDMKGKPYDPDSSAEDYPSGCACLEGYSKDVSPAAGMRLREMPKHDLFSHSSDAFRTFGEAWSRGMVHAGEQTTTKKPKTTGAVRKPRVTR
jgi:hypothetical protein